VVVVVVEKKEGRKEGRMEVEDGSRRWKVGVEM
jgi:hypothetical protein